MSEIIPSQLFHLNIDSFQCQGNVCPNINYSMDYIGMGLGYWTI